jgi:cyclase
MNSLIDNGKRHDLDVAADMLSRRDLLGSSFALGAAAALSLPASASAAPATPNGSSSKLSAIELAPGVHALIAPANRIWCNFAWVTFKDYTLVLDGGTRFEAQEVLPVIRATSDKPIWFVLNTHHHGDHSYGNAFWVHHGATVMGNTNIATEYARVEPSRLHMFPAAKLKPQFAAEMAVTQLHPPSMLLPSHSIFDDGKQRVELLHFGAAHTTADTIAWLPKQKILFAGDVVVNGPYNVMWDAHVLSWLNVLAKVESLRPATVIPGHGAIGDGLMVGDQRAYFAAIRDSVHAVVANGGDAGAVRAAVPKTRAALLANAHTAHWTITDDTFLPDLLSLSGQMGRFYTEFTGKRYVALGSPEDRHARAIANLCCAALRI